ncbi:MAG: SH3 domain-containing protein [Desulfobacteraceae bacterium]|nr:SH3 domain-containing protein [Desulfobacteraceae bacterium]
MRRPGWGHLREGLLAAVALVLLTASMASARMVSVSGAKVNVRSGPGTRYSLVCELGDGYPLKVIGTKGKWLKVTDFENDKGWVLSRVVGRVPHVVVKVKRAVIRSGSGTHYRVVGRADYGVVFRTVENRGGWVKVKHESGLIGWIDRRLLWGW